MPLPEGPNSRTEEYLANIAGQTDALPEAPNSRVEQYLDHIARSSVIVPYDNEDFVITAIGNVNIAGNNVIEIIGEIPWLDAEGVAEHSEYGITEPGYYVFLKIDGTGLDGAVVGSETTVIGADGYVATVGNTYVDVALRFKVSAISKKVTVNWSSGVATEYVFAARDQAIENLDYRTTFYVYPGDKYATWTYKLTTDTTFSADKWYYTKSGDVYTKAEVTAGETIPADTYYDHGSLTISGMTRNVTYALHTPVDCPVTFILPEVNDTDHGCWFEIWCLFTGTFSMTLVPPSSDVKVATEHTQQEQKGINMINLHYADVAGTKVWRFLNTRSTVPA